MSKKVKTTKPISSSNSELTQQRPVMVGLDLGTNTSCLQASFRGSEQTEVDTIVPTIVGYANEGILDGILPRGDKTLFGIEALEQRLHLNMERPLRKGIIQNLKPARDFARHLRSRLNIENGSEIRAVVGVPAQADSASRENVRTAVTGVFDKVILIPEPFLAALGYRDESRLDDPDYVDPVRNSMFIDIGAGSADICLVQGYFPLTDDQVSIDFAGDAVDELLLKEILQTYPDCQLSLNRVRELKEEFSYVGEADPTIEVDVIIGGKSRRLQVGEQIATACNELLNRIFEKVRNLIGKADGDSISELLQNIVLTGGGSRIRDIAPTLQRLLENDGFAEPKVRSIGENYKQHVANGALKAANQAKERQWQRIIS